MLEQIMAIPVLHLQIVALVVLLSLSGVFSSFETAIASINKIQVHQFINDKKKNAKYTKKLKDDINRSIITILIGNNLVNISASALATIIATKLFGSSGVGIAIGVLTLLILIFGEITPKAYAVRNADKLTENFSKIIYYMSVVLSPLIWILSKISTAIIRMIGGEIEDNPEVTPESIKAIAEIGEEEGLFAETEKKIIHRVVEFNNTTAGKIMVPRVKMYAIDVHDKPVSIKKEIEKLPYSRLPVYDRNKDRIIGILLVREFLKKYSPNMSIRRVMRNAYFITQEERIDDVLREMQDRNIHIAIVLDPDGGVAGLVSMEDILEELVGDIYDETDINKHLLRHINSRSIEVDANTKLKNIDELLKISLPREKVSSFGSLNEFILNKLGHIPKPGEKVKLDNVIIEVRKVNRHKIEQVKISKK